eukprot:COSAG03_NODE_1147_length_4711_cov_3.503469_7_plen_66_part_00
MLARTFHGDWHVACHALQRATLSSVPGLHTGRQATRDHTSVDDLAPRPASQGLSMPLALSPDAKR